MRIILTAAILLYWLFIAYLPIAMVEAGSAVKVLIGCRSHGECYAKGWWIAAQLKLWATCSALAIWPFVAWKFICFARYLKQKYMADRTNGLEEHP